MIVNGVDCGWFGEKCNQGGGRGAAGTAKPAPTLTSRFEGVDVRNNKVIAAKPAPVPTSRFKGVNPQTFNKSSITSNPTLNNIENTVEKITGTNLPEWAIPVGIMGLVALIIFLFIR